MDQEISEAREGGFPPVEDLLPHRPPMLLVRNVVGQVAGGGLACTGSIPGDHPYAGPTGAPPVLGIEMAAQAAGILDALERAGWPGREGREGAAPGPPRVGYLVSIRDAHFEVPLLPLDRPLAVTVFPDGGAAALRLFRIAVTDEGAEVLRAVVGTMAAPR